MKNHLQAYFPMLRTRQELAALIQSHPHLQAQFASWPEKRQQEFLDFTTGARGVKLLYDPFFKEIMNPETTPERLEHFLSLLLHTKISIRRVLPGDSTRLADENSLVITDLVVEFENQEIANVEIQKIGYRFPGQRSACYSADLLLRQYKRTRSRQKKRFDYRSIRSVYVIVLFEESPREFHVFPDEYLHYFSQKSNTCVELELLQKYIFIPLDIFREIRHNRGIQDELEAWLTFLSTDEPQEILTLIRSYPMFKPMYEQLYDQCKNVEEVMKMFSKELQILDRNTVQFMIDDMQRTIHRKNREIARQKRKYAAKIQESERQQEKDRQHYEQQLTNLTQQLATLTARLSQLEHGQA